MISKGMKMIQKTDEELESMTNEQLEIYRDTLWEEITRTRCMIQQKKSEGVKR